jgi:hypothetical protein
MEADNTSHRSAGGVTARFLDCSTSCLTRSLGGGGGCTGVGVAIGQYMTELPRDSLAFWSRNAFQVWRHDAILSQ